MIGSFLLVPKRCASPEVLQARRLVVGALTEICLHAYDRSLDALADRPIPSLGFYAYVSPRFRLFASSSVQPD